MEFILKLLFYLFFSTGLTRQRGREQTKSDSSALPSSNRNCVDLSFTDQSALFFLVAAMKAGGSCCKLPFKASEEEVEEVTLSQDDAGAAFLLELDVIFT